MQASLHNGLRSASLRRMAFKAARTQHTVAAAAKSSVIREIHNDLATKKRSAVEVTQHYLDAISKADGVVCSFITVDAEQALEQVRVLLQYVTACDWQAAHRSTHTVLVA